MGVMYQTLSIIMCHLSSKSGYPIFLAASSCFRQPVPFFFLLILCDELQMYKQLIFGLLLFG